MSLLRRGGSNKGDKGGKEREPGPSGSEPAGRKAPDFGVPKVEDPYGSVVSYLVHDTRSLDEIRPDLERQYKGNQGIVDLVMGRVTTGRAERAQKEQH